MQYRVEERGMCVCAKQLLRGRSVFGFTRATQMVSERQEYRLVREAAYKLREVCTRIRLRA